MSGGGGTGTLPGWSTLYASRTAMPRSCAARSAPPTDRREVVGQMEVVDRDVERVLRGADEVSERLRGVGGRLAAVGQRADFDRLYSRFAAW